MPGCHAAGRRLLCAMNRRWPKHTAPCRDAVWHPVRQGHTPSAKAEPFTLSVLSVSLCLCASVVNNPPRGHEKTRRPTSARRVRQRARSCCTRTLSAADPRPMHGNLKTWATLHEAQPPQRARQVYRPPRRRSNTALRGARIGSTARSHAACGFAEPPDGPSAHDKAVEEPDRDGCMANDMQRRRRTSRSRERLGAVPSPVVSVCRGRTKKPTGANTRGLWIAALRRRGYSMAV